MIDRSVGIFGEDLGILFDFADLVLQYLRRLVSIVPQIFESHFTCLAELYEALGRRQDTDDALGEGMHRIAYKGEMLHGGDHS